MARLVRTSVMFVAIYIWVNTTPPPPPPHTHTHTHLTFPKCRTVRFLWFDCFCDCSLILKTVISNIGLYYFFGLCMYLFLTPFRALAVWHIALGLILPLSHPFPIELKVHMSCTCIIDILQIFQSVWDLKCSCRPTSHEIESSNGWCHFDHHVTSFSTENLFFIPIKLLKGTG